VDVAGLFHNLDLCLHFLKSVQLTLNPLIECLIKRERIEVESVLSASFVIFFLFARKLNRAMFRGLLCYASIQVPDMTTFNLIISYTNIYRKSTAWNVPKSRIFCVECRYI
jgi:hypothetical protein